MWMIDSNFAVAYYLRNKAIAFLFLVYISRFFESLEVIKPIFRKTVLQLHFDNIELEHVDHILG